MDWQPAPDLLIEMIEEDFENVVVNAKYAKLPFYVDGYMVRAEMIEDSLALVFGGLCGVTICALDGTSDQIRMANRIGGLVITKENVVEYARFFGEHLEVETGNFVLVENLSGLSLSNGTIPTQITPSVEQLPEDGSFTLDAFTIHNRRLYRVVLHVTLDGAVDMTHDECFGELFTVQ